MYLPRPRSLPSVDFARPTCYSCFRPESHCVCRLVDPFEAHTNFLILQHPHERRKFHATTKIVMNTIRNARLIRGILFEPEHIQSALGGTSPYLLYPGPDAQDSSEAPLDTSSTVIVIDGTWDEAQKIVYRNPFLRAFPRLSFRQELRSEYLIRRQPKPGCLSTLESIAYLLKINADAFGLTDGNVYYDRLLRGFDVMVERQLAFFPRRSLDIGSSENP